MALFTEILEQDPRVQEIHKSYLQHPFLKELLSNSLPHEKFHYYLIQDSLYLKDYAKVYAQVFMLTENTEDLQFLHGCIGVIVADETNMHKRYLNKHGLTFKAIDQMEVDPRNRAYLDYMLGFADTKDAKKIFVSALPCTLTYEFIGAQLLEALVDSDDEHYYREWIETYGGEGFKVFADDSREYINRLCKDCSETEINELIEIYLKACDHEMNFWDMSYGM